MRVEGSFFEAVKPGPVGIGEIRIMEMGCCFNHLEPQLPMKNEGFKIFICIYLSNFWMSLVVSSQIDQHGLAGRVSSQCSGSHCSKLRFILILSLGDKIIASLKIMQIGGNTWRIREKYGPPPKKDKRFF